MKKFFNVAAILMMALCMSGCLGGKYMVGYALTPEVHGVADIDRTRHKADSLAPGSTAWYDSLQTRGILKDTLVVGYN
ncbi:hypothetical protein RCJ22_15825, partial [Vibrio sp. FNV 38]|nr:hypothetical protein [Vibrio sp. FNV 38]